MNLSELCIRRPVMTVLLCVSLVVAGLIAYTKMPIAALPSFNTPTINVTAVFPGASPDTMAASVALPLEKQFATIAGINVISSVNTLGNTSITLEFNNNRDIDAAAVDVQAALLRAQRSLPVEMTQPPAYRKVNPADTPILFLALDSPSMPLSEVDRYIENWISPQLSTLDGVAQVQIYGQQKFAVRIRVNPEQLAAYGLTIDDVSAAVNAANSNTPTGLVEDDRQTLTIQANEQLQTAAVYADIIIANRAGGPVRLRDVANVVDSVENTRIGNWTNGKRSITIAILRQPDANTVAVVDAIKKALPKLEAGLPGSLRITLLNDRSSSIRDSINDVKFTLMLTACLVIAVIFVFLRRLAATAIPAVSLPISLIGTLSLMYWLGDSLDNISLLGITLAVGLVVDDAIVMLENIVRHIEGGMSPMQAALTGSREIAFTIVSISVSLVAIFIPIFFMQGVIGLLFREFAVVVSLSVLVSAAVSLTIIPLLCSRFLKAEPQGHAHKPERGPGAWFEAMFQAVLNAYSRTLDWALRYRWLVLAGAVGTFVLTAVLFQAIPKGFFPDEDTGQIQVTTEAAEDISYPGMVSLQNRLVEVLRADPYVFSINSSVEAAGAIPTVNTARMFITLKGRKERPKMPQMLERLRAEVATIPGITAYFNPVQNLRLGGRVSKSRYQYTLQSVRAGELSDWAQRMQQAMRDDKVFRDVTTDAQQKGLIANLRIDRDKANTLGVDITSIRSALYSAFGVRQIGTIYTSVDNYQVIIEAGSDYASDESALTRLYAHGNGGKLIPFSAFATVDRSNGPTAINHQGQLQAITISFNLAPGAALGDAASHISQIKSRIALPITVLTSFGGDAAAFQETQGSQLVLLLIAVGVIYVLLGVLYESYIHPLTILSGLPSAAVGALGTLMIFHQDLTMIALIGILMLIGIVKKNAIMMIDFALEAERSHGLPAAEAIRQACLLRFRPIIMTTLAALMGALPIAVGFGAGAELRQPLGLAVVGGLLFSQVITLYVTPVLYLAFDALQTRMGMKTHTVHGAIAGVPKPAV